MYPGYTTQQALQDQRVRELTANANTDRIPQRRIARFFATLRGKLSSSAQTGEAHAKAPVAQSKLQARQWK
jgi:hypothetical protein